jgi:hypothetical protein
VDVPQKAERIVYPKVMAGNQPDVRFFALREARPRQKPAILSDINCSGNHRRRSF